MITLTDSAKKKIAELIKDEKNDKLKFRAYIEGGGCSGFKYGFAFDENIEDGDFEFDQGDFKLVVDSVSYQYLHEAKLDYRKSLFSSEFVVSNPNVKATCGCGSSFTA